MSLPTDLIPLPTMPWTERPLSLPLDIEECRTALWLEDGNVTRAAERLRTTSLRLRNFIAKSPRLVEEQKEAHDRIVDIAEDNIKEALTDGTDPGRRDSMSKFVVANLGRHRGYGTGVGAVKVGVGGGKVNITWGDGSSLSVDADSNDDMKTIDGEIVNG